MITHQNAKEEIDAYINQLPGWSKMICNKLRTIILNADKAIIEDWKWGPHYKTDKGMVAGFSAFARHAKLTFFNGSQMEDKEALFNHCTDNEFSRSIKFTDVKEINEKLTLQYIKEAVAISNKGFKRETKSKNKIIEIPTELIERFKSSGKAKEFFNNISYSHQKEFVEWIVSAKKEETKKARAEKAIIMMEQKAALNDKYKR